MTVDNLSFALFSGEKLYREVFKKKDQLHPGRTFFPSPCAEKVQVTPPETDGCFSQISLTELFRVSSVFYD